MVIPSLCSMVGFREMLLVIIIIPQLPSLGKVKGVRGSLKPFINSRLHRWRLSNEGIGRGAQVTAEIPPTLTLLACSFTLCSFMVSPDKNNHPYYFAFDVRRSFPRSPRGSLNREDRNVTRTPPPGHEPRYLRFVFPSSTSGFFEVPTLSSHKAHEKARLRLDLFVIK